MQSLGQVKAQTFNHLEFVFVSIPKCEVLNVSHNSLEQKSCFDNCTTCIEIIIACKHHFNKKLLIAISTTFPNSISTSKLIQKHFYTISVSNYIDRLRTDANTAIKSVIYHILPQVLYTIRQEKVYDFGLHFTLMEC